MHFANFSATKSSASSHETRSRPLLLAPRTSGYFARPHCALSVIVRCSVDPLVQSFPRLEGCAGSPATPVMRVPSLSTSTPQPVPQQQHTDRVTVTAPGGPTR